MSEDPPTETAPVTIGMAVYDGEGHKLGTIRGFDEDGFFVTTRAGIAAMSVEHEHPAHGFGEAELLWRCAECGIVGDIDAVPERCPDCGAAAESIYYWTED